MQGFGAKKHLEIESNGIASAGVKQLNEYYLSGLVIAGITADWYCAFEWFSRKYSLFSGTVIQRMILIVLWCAAIGFLAGLTRREKWQRWQLGVAVFLFASVNVSGNLLMWWTGHRR